MRIAYLGPAGTFTEDALRAALQGQPADLVPSPTVYDAIRAVDAQAADRALVPFENSIEGAVRSTLDTLAFDTPSVTIVGEHDYPIRHALIARRRLALGEIEAVLSHPQASAQCARFIREKLRGAEVRAAPSTAEAVRQVADSDRPWAALAARAAAGIYDFEALLEFSRRGVNLTRIESRPRRRGLGRYMFFPDLEGSIEDPVVAAAIEGLGSKAESVRVLGSYPVETVGIPGGAGPASG